MKYKINLLFVCPSLLAWKFIYILFSSVSSAVCFMWFVVDIRSFLNLIFLLLLACNEEEQIWVDLFCAQRREKKNGAWVFRLNWFLCHSRVIKKVWFFFSDAVECARSVLITIYWDLVNGSQEKVNLFWNCPIVKSNTKIARKHQKLHEANSLTWSKIGKYSSATERTFSRDPNT